MPKRKHSMFGLGTKWVVGRVVYRLIRTLKEPDIIERAVREILPQVFTLSSKLELIRIVGYRKGAGHKLISEADANKLEKEWRNEVCAASTDLLTGEDELLRILLLVRREADPGEPYIEIEDSPHLTLALLRSARSEVQRQSMGSRAVRRSPRLAWDALVELYGEESTLRERIGKLKASQFEGNGEILQLADKYLGGWRPSDFEDD